MIHAADDNNTFRDVSEVTCNGIPIRNMYKLHHGEYRQIYSADLIYFGVSSQMIPSPNELVVKNDWGKNIVARREFARLTFDGRGKYPYIAIPKRYADNISILINGIECTMNKFEQYPLSQTRYVIRGVPYVVFALMNKQNGIVTIQGKYNG